MSGTFVLSDMEFPEFGMVCPLSGCAGSTFFRKFHHLKKHWLQFHQRLVTLHKCSICETVFGAKRDGGKHIRSHHGQRGCLTSFTKVNCRFMSPGEVTLPLPRKKSSMPTNLTPREQAALQRQRIAAIAENSPAAALSQRGPRITTRDTEVIQKPDGSMAQRRKRLWGPLSTPEPEMELNYVDDLDN